MKRLIILLLFSFSVQAEQLDCGLVGEVTRSIMTNRQANTNLKEMMTIANKYGQFAESLVIAAYKMPRYSSRDYQQFAIDEFANDIMVRV